MNKLKVLLAQLNSNGDCLYATVIARQIKEVDYPGCHLTWAVSSKCLQSVLLNPHVDEIWEVPTLQSLTSNKEWAAFVKTAEQRKAEGDFDIIFYTQIIGKNVINLNGDIRSSIYKNYPHPIKISQQPIIQLSETEVENVRQFAEQNNLQKYKQVILVECGPDSFKSSLNPAFATRFANEFASKNEDMAFILSSNKKIESSSPQIIDASVLSFRENAELTKYCQLFIGCSSGISWLGTTNQAKPLPKILIINDKAVLNTSMVSDHELAGLPTAHIIELHESATLLEELSQCFQKVLSGTFEEAKAAYHKPFKRKNFKYLYHVAKSSFAQWDLIFPFKAFNRSNQKEGFSFNALYHLLKAYVKLPFYIIMHLIKKLSAR